MEPVKTLMQAESEVSAQPVRSWTQRLGSGLDTMLRNIPIWRTYQDRRELQEMERLDRERAVVEESLATLHSQLSYIRAGVKGYSLMAMSAYPEEGKTSTLAGFARMACQVGDRVLLIDADLRRPALHDALGLPNRAGLSDYLGGRLADGKSAKGAESDNPGQVWENAPVHQVILHNILPGLDFIPAGQRRASPLQLLRNPTLKQLLNMAAQAYDWVLIDVPPIEAVSDSQVLFSQVDGILLVIQVGRVSEANARRMVKRLASAGGNVVGVVLNRFEQATSKEYALYRYYEERGDQERRGKGSKSPKA
ncbi:MAG: tyrosine-protein kinase family protein [Chloroflexi bacterium]|nr:tyrosine-protein kinase family protein [Chloroflexota bacterium]